MNCASRVVRPHPMPTAPPSTHHASGPETRVCVLLALGALEQVLGSPEVVERDGIDHRA